MHDRHKGWDIPLIVAMVLSFIAIQVAGDIGLLSQHVVDMAMLVFVAIVLSPLLMAIMLVVYLLALRVWREVVANA